MQFSDFVGLGALPGRLRSDFSGGQHVNAYLFAGPDGTGKSEMAAVCARALNCAGAQKPCDECPACQRALAGVHTDIEVLAPDGKKSITVDEVRDLIAKVMIRPFEGGSRAVIIKGADLMTVQAQNALLKTLESGPDSAVFFLIAGGTGKLLTTILSRCRIVRFHAIDEALCAEVLASRGIEPIKTRLLARAGAGCVGRALELSEDEGYFKLRGRVIEAVAACAEPNGVSAASALIKDDKDRSGDVLDIIEEVGRSLIERGEIGENAAGDSALDAISLRGDKLIRAALHARERLASNIVWINLIENMFLEISQKGLYS